MKLKIIFISILTMLLITACQDKKNEDLKTDAAAENDLQTTAHKAKVEEVLEAKSYTYLRLSENGNDYWIAITKRPMETGETVYFDKGLKMENFKSADLNRTFESVLFVQDISTHPTSSQQPMMGGNNGQMGKPNIQKEDVSIAPAEGGITISKLFANKKSYENKTVKIKGKITAFNSDIMDKNWAHIQDGTSSGDNYDLTVTTNKDVKVGDVVTFEGKIALNKDFGYGYSYEVLMEDAK